MLLYSAVRYVENKSRMQEGLKPSPFCTAYLFMLYYVCHNQKIHPFKLPQRIVTHCLSLCFALL